MATIYELSRKESGSASEGIMVTRVFRVVPWTEAFDIADILLGGVALTGGQLIRTPPASDPWLPWCFCQHVDIQGGGQFGVTAPLVNTILDAKNYYEWAILTAVYRTLDYDPYDAVGPVANESQEIEICTESLDFAAQNLTLDGVDWKWQQITPTEKRLSSTNTNVTKTFIFGDYMLTRHLVLTLPLTSITKLLGTINASAFTGPVGKVFPIETLRFDGLHTVKKSTQQGSRFTEISYAFKINANYGKVDDGTVTTWAGWNRLYRPDTARWEKPLLVSDTTRTIFQRDETVLPASGTVPAGFKALFHPKAG